MRNAILPLLILTVALPAAAQRPPRRADELRALQRALLEAERARATTSIELELERMMRAGRQDERSLELQRILEAEHRARTAKSAQLEQMLLDAQYGHTAEHALLATAGPARHDEAAYRALADAQRTASARVAGAFEAALDRIAERGPAEPWAAQDPADSIYRAARELLNRGSYREAARAFERISTETRYARSEYRPAAYYWHAFSLARMGSPPELRLALERLALLRSSYPRHELLDDAASLAATIDSRLARNGDARAMQALERQARSTGTAAAGQQCEDDDIRSVALNALLQMESANAVPILREVMARRDACSAPLRRRAMMMLAQHQSADAQNILIEAALNDPDPQVREQATFWLSHVHTDAAVDALARILSGNPSADVRQRAVFALAQHPNARAGEILRDYALRTDLSDDLRRQIVMSLAHSSRDNGPFLRQLYDRTADVQLKSHIVMALALDPSPELADWIIGVALDADAPDEVRRQALMMAMHNQAIGTERIVRIYDQTTDPELRRFIVVALGQRVSDPVALDKLIQVARTSDDTDLQKQVIIMLGQSRDPRVAELLAEIIRRPVR